jgi:hypothetical protein
MMKNSARNDDEKGVSQNGIKVIPQCSAVLSLFLSLPNYPMEKAIFYVDLIRSHATTGNDLL